MRNMRDVGYRLTEIINYQFSLCVHFLLINIATLPIAVTMACMKKDAGSQD